MSGVFQRRLIGYIIERRAPDGTLYCDRITSDMSGEPEQCCNESGGSSGGDGSEVSPPPAIPEEDLTECLLQFMEENSLFELPSVIYANFPDGFVNVGGQGTCPIDDRVGMTYLSGSWVSNPSPTPKGIIQCVRDLNDLNPQLVFTFRDNGGCTYTAVISIDPGWDGTGTTVGDGITLGGGFVPPCDCDGFATATADTKFTTT